MSRRKIIALRRLRRVRETMRNLAAAKAGQAEALLSRRGQERQATVEKRRTIFAEAGQRLTGVRAIAELEACRAEIVAANCEVERADRELAAAEKQRREAAYQLGHRMRQLKTTEAVIDRVARKDEADRNRVEQGQIDDMVAAKIGTSK